MDIVALFYDLDQFAVAFEPAWHRRLLEDGRVHRRRPGRLCLGEVMTILVLFHGSGYRTFKDYYLGHVRAHMRGDFPRTPSYNRFVDPSTALRAFPRRSRRSPRSSPERFVDGDGLAFADSTALRVCHNGRINSHRVMAGLAARGKTSTGWFYGFKLQP